ncbi:MAG: hypothetical protein PHV93_01480 [Candidatus Pacebacteria bacterium]|nr:hypothetical protein [Candidatus Paceibacterota bacterium]
MKYFLPILVVILIIVGLYYYYFNAGHIVSSLKKVDTVSIPAEFIPKQANWDEYPGAVRGISPSGKYDLSILPPSEQKDSQNVSFRLIDLKNQSKEKQIAVAGLGPIPTNTGFDVEVSFQWINDSTVLIYKRMPFAAWYLNVETGKSHIIFSAEDGRQGLYNYSQTGQALWYTLSGKLHRFDFLSDSDTIISGYSEASGTPNQLILSNRGDKFLKVVTNSAFVVDASSGQEEFIFSDPRFHGIEKHLFQAWSENDKRINLQYPFVYDLEHHKSIDLKDSYAELSINLGQKWYGDDALVVHNSRDGSWYLLNIFDKTYKRIVQ